MEEIKTRCLAVSLTGFNYTITNDRISLTATLPFKFVLYGDDRDIITKKYMGFSENTTLYTLN